MGLFDNETIYDLFIFTVSYLKDVWAYWFSINVPRIQKVSLVYMRDYSKKVPEFVNDLLSTHDYEDVTLEYRIGGAKHVLKDVSPEVTDYFFEILYKVNSKEYVYLTRNPDHVFPPPRPNMSFRLPVQEAFLMAEPEVPIEGVEGAGERTGAILGVVGAAATVVGHLGDVAGGAAVRLAGEETAVGVLAHADDVG